MHALERLLNVFGHLACGFDVRHAPGINLMCQVPHEEVEMGDAGHAGSPPLLQAHILSQPAPPRGLRHRAASTGPRRPRAASDALELAGQTEV